MLGVFFAFCWGCFCAFWGCFFAFFLCSFLGVFCAFGVFFAFFWCSFLFCAFGVFFFLFFARQRDFFSGINFLKHTTPKRGIPALPVGPVLLGRETPVALKCVSLSNYIT